MKYISDDQGTMSTKKMPGCTGVMSSFNYVGTEWAGGRKSLLTGLLRDEWGFRGAVITDFNLYGYMEKDPSLLAGNDLQLTYSAMTGSIANADKADIVAAMRTAMHNVCYTVVNSNAMNGLAPGSSVKYGIAPWQYGVYGGTAVLVALGALLGYKAVKTNKALKEQAATLPTSPMMKAARRTKPSSLPLAPFSSGPAPFGAGPDSMHGTRRRKVSENHSYGDGRVCPRLAPHGRPLMPDSFPERRKGA